MKIKNILNASVLGLALVAGGAVASAQTTTPTTPDTPRAERGFGKEGKRGGHGMMGRHGKRGGHGAGRAFAQLNLTDAQKEQMKAISLRFRETTKALREQMRAARGTKGETAYDGTFNEAQVRADAQADNNLRVELAVARARMRSEMYNVLTAEQKTQLQQLKEQRKQQREQFKARRQAAQPTIN